MKIMAQSMAHKVSSRGFSLVEVLVAMLLIAVALVPALQALQSGVQAAKIDLTLTQETPTAKMEQVLARSFAALALAATSGIATNVGSNSTPIAIYNPTVSLVNPLPVAIPAGPGFSDENYDVYIDCLDIATSNTLTAGPCGRLLRIRVLAKDTNQQLVTYKAQ